MRGGLRHVLRAVSQLQEGEHGVCYHMNNVVPMLESREGVPMGKKLYSISLDEELVPEIDEVAKAIGISRSSLINATMRGVVSGETKEVLAMLAESVKAKKQAEKKAKKQARTATA